MHGASVDVDAQRCIGGEASVPRLPPPVRDESTVVRELLSHCGDVDWAAAAGAARPWVEAVREHPAPFWALESLLRDYPISSREGLALMRLAEALLRVPDGGTAALLAADQLADAQFDAGGADASAVKVVFARVLDLSRRLLPDDEATARGLVARLGASGVVAAAVRAIALLGRQFVLGENLSQAQRRAAAQRREQPALRFSYDMLGEGARSAHDAARYAEAYRATLQALAAQTIAGGPEVRDGMSIKLSALHPRFEEAQRARVFAELLPQLEQLARQAAAAEINLTLDAEESERLELQLDLLDALAARLDGDPACAAWRGLGLALQAYQTRAASAVDAVLDIARTRRRRLMVRLVKGAYWDAEIKRAQELGLSGYPVFTHKHHTDLSYLACARLLLDAAQGPDAPVYPQFATHNAGSIAAVLQLASQRPRARFELQRLHGMGDGIYREVLKQPDVPCRVYAPVGAHRDLLAYLVRRLLENGANTSFVHRLVDASVPAQDLLHDPLWLAEGQALPAPRDLYGSVHGAPRPNPLGFDPADAPEREGVLNAVRALALPAGSAASPAQVDAAMRGLHEAFPAWDATPPRQRREALLRAADLLEQRRDACVALLMREAHKTLGDALAEVREAIDYCRYYALQAQRLDEVELQGPTGQSDRLRCRGRGVFVCISPWNFPLGIFAGQVAAALVAGNTVAAKPAEQTPACAEVFAQALFDAGVPRAALRVMHGPGETVGAALVAHERTAGVAFTGSTAVARQIQRSLAEKPGPIVPLIAETGGVNAMIVDSTALPEQVVDAVVSSAFRSAGQRCSALRLLCLQDDIADTVLNMLGGAMDELCIGPAWEFSTDVPPVIDRAAWDGLMGQIGRLEQEAVLLHRTAWPAGLAAAAGGSARPEGLRCAESALAPWAQGPARELHFIAPQLFAIDDAALAREEIFGPVLQVVRWPADGLDALVDAVNGLGYGLTLGIQTRIDARARRIAQRARCGNVYVNRNMIGAVVGVQPFGGEGLSGTGPKAGGPHYLLRFCSEQSVSVNTAAAGGNALLLAQAAL